VSTERMGPGCHSPVMVGRDKELDVLRQAVIRARQGSGGMVLVTGEAGIGKSRLLEEASGYARTLGMAVLAGGPSKVAGRTGRWPNP